MLSDAVRMFPITEAPARIAALNWATISPRTVPRETTSGGLHIPEYAAGRPYC